MGMLAAAVALLLAQDERRARVDEALPAILERARVPGASVALVEGGRLAWAKGYGRREAGAEGAVDVETLFQAASISKPVAAMAALKRVEAGALALDEDVNGRLKGWKVPDSPLAAEQRVTLRRLLSHSAGLTVHGFAGYPADRERPTLVQVLDGEKPANSQPVRVTLAPGSAFRYSGGGYCVVQQLLVDAAGKPYPDLLRETVLGPLGMSKSTAEQPLPDARRANAASAHRADGSPLRTRWHVYPEMAAAGLWTTPTDLASFGLELLKPSGKVLSEKMTKEMLTPQAGKAGLGIFVEGEGKAARFHHGGSNAGFRCMLVVYRETGQGAAVMTNGDGGDRAVGEILQALAKEYGWPR